MTEGTCENADCTVATTGKCLLSQPEPEDCPHFRSGNGSIAIEAVTPDLNTLAGGPKQPPAEKQASRKFHLGSELGVQDANDISRARYAHLIGVLGSSDAGKTCFLSSLYLMASGGTLPYPYLFRGCETLQAFEDRARGLREWEGGKLRGQLVDHTILSDTRQPSLLHLAIRESQGERRTFDLLLTDLPGEWTDKLVLRSTYADAFRFLHRADGIILVVDGTQLISDEFRHEELQRMRYFTERLANDVNVSRDTPFVILVSKADEIEMKMPPAAEELRSHVAALGFPARTILASAFSRTPEKVKSGTGVFEAIDTILSHPFANTYASPTAESFEPGARTWQRFRG